MGAFLQNNSTAKIMKNGAKGFGIIVAMWGFSSAALAGTGAEEGSVTASVSGGTLGIGPEISYQMSDQVGLRGNVTMLSVSREIDSDDVTYDGKVKLQSGGVMLDYYPGGGNFRLSAGARINGNKAEVSATPTASVTINGTTYTPAQIGTLRGDADFKSVAPVVTLGFGRKSKGFAFGIDAGVMVQGRARVNAFTASGTGVSAADLNAERADIQDDVSKFKVYPVLQFSLGYRF